MNRFFLSIIAGVTFLLPVFAEEQVPAPAKDQQAVQKDATQKEAELARKPEIGLDMEILLAHLLSQAHFGTSPFTDKDPGTGAAPLATVVQGDQTIRIWYNPNYTPPPKPADPPQSQPQPAAQPAGQPTAKPPQQSSNEENILQEQKELFSFILGQAQAAKTGQPSNVTITQLMDPQMAAHLAWIRERQKWQDFGDSMRTWGEGSRNMFEGIGDSMRSASESLSRGGQNQINGLRSIEQLKHLEWQLNQRR